SGSARPDREAERVSEAVSPHARCVVGGVARVKGVRGEAAARIGVEPEDLSREAPDPLRAERANVLEGVELSRPERQWVSAAGIHVRDQGPVARAHEEGAIEAEAEAANRVTVRQGRWTR